ncbi:MAG: hypothetical protein ACK5VV_00170 [Lysobacteraceae bacterium]
MTLPSRRPRRVRPFLAMGFAVLVVLNVPATPAWASGIPVFDVNQLMAQVEARFEFIQTLRRYEQQIAQWRNLLSQNPMERVREAVGGRPKLGDKLTLRGDTDGIQQRCGASGGGIGGLLGNLFDIRFDANGDLREQQTKLCEVQVVLENRRWNENVLMIKQMELLQEKADAVADARRSGMTQGEIDTNLVDLKVAQDDYERNAVKGKARIATYDEMLGSVATMQRMAAEELLRGSRPTGFSAAVAETIVQGAVLRSVLRVGNGGCGDRLGQPCD